MTHTGSLLALAAPRIAYLSILPELVMLGGAVAVLAASSVLRRRMDPTTATVLGRHDRAGARSSLSLVQWFDVAHHGAHVTIDSAVVEDGFSALVTILCRARRSSPPWSRTGGCAGSRPTGPEFQALMLLSVVGGDDHGGGQRPHRGVPGSRDHVHRPVRAGRHEPPAVGVRRGGAQVLRPGLVLLGRVPVRDGPRLRRHRVDEPAPDRRLPGAQRPAAQRAAPGGHGAAARRLRVQGGGRAVPPVDARRLPGLAQPGHGLHGGGGQGGRVRRAVAGVRLVVRDRAHRLAAGRMGARRDHLAARGRGRPRPARRQADARLFVDQPRRLRAPRAAGGHGDGASRGRSTTSSSTRSWSSGASPWSP